MAQPQAASAAKPQRAPSTSVRLSAKATKPKLRQKKKVRPARVSEVNQDIPARLRNLRVYRGLTQAEMADAAGTTAQNYAKQERGVARIYCEQMVCYIQALKVPAAEIMSFAVGAQEARN